MKKLGLLKRKGALKSGRRFDHFEWKTYQKELILLPEKDAITKVIILAIHE